MGAAKQGEILSLQRDIERFEQSLWHGINQKEYSKENRAEERRIAVKQRLNSMRERLNILHESDCAGKNNLPADHDYEWSSVRNGYYCTKCNHRK